MRILLIKGLAQCLVHSRFSVKDHRKYGYMLRVGIRAGSRDGAGDWSEKH